MTEEDMEAVRRLAFEMWGLEGDTLDVVDAFHAWQILNIKLVSKRIHSFDDFVVSWKKYK